MALAHGVLQFSSHTNSQAVDFTHFKCSQHLKNQYMYFCLSQNCQKPICIQCQKNHTQQHKNKGINEKYVSFSEHMRNQSQTLRLLINKSKTLKTSISKQLVDKRAKYLKIINEHFDNLQKIASEIELHPKFIKQLEDNYKEIQQGKSYFISEDIKDQNIPELVSNTILFEQFLKDNNYIKPGIQIVSNGQPRKRHYSQKINLPKDKWVDAPQSRQFSGTPKSCNGKPQINVLLTQKLSFGVKKEDKNKQTPSVQQLTPKKDAQNENPQYMIINFKQKQTKQVHSRSKAATTSAKLTNNQQISPNGIQFKH